MSSFEKDAIKRVELYLLHNKFDRPADIIADVMHYCRGQADFDKECEVALAYVDQEQTFDDDVVIDEELA